MKIKKAQAVELQINVDGLPLYKSNNTQFWPILGLIMNCSPREPFVIGLFCRNSKPNNVAAYLNDFVTEFEALQISGYNV